MAGLVGGTLEGGDDPELTGVAPLDRAGPEHLSFLADRRYAAYLPAAEAGAVLIGDDLAAEVETDRPRIRVGDVRRALATLLAHLHPEPRPEPGVHPTAILGAGVRLGRDVTIGPYAVIGREVEIGDRVRIGAHTVVGDECALADDVLLHPHVVLYRGVRVGARSVMHSGVRLGVDGFGYVPGETGLEKVPQVGGCVIGCDVEIGANTTIDRGSVGPTEVGDGVKIDNLVQVGHNVRIGDGVIIVAQVGIAGSVTVGAGATLAGQAGIGGHVRIGKGATVAGQAGVFGDVPDGAVYSGYPARPHKEALRAQAALFRVPQVLKRLRALERGVSEEKPGE